MLSNVVIKKEEKKKDKTRFNNADFLTSGENFALFCFWEKMNSTRSLGLKGAHNVSVACKMVNLKEEFIYKQTFQQTFNGASFHFTRIKWIKSHFSLVWGCSFLPHETNTAANQGQCLLWTNKMSLFFLSSLFRFLFSSGNSYCVLAQLSIKKKVSVYFSPFLWAMQWAICMRSTSFRSAGRQCLYILFLQRCFCPWLFSLLWLLVFVHWSGWGKCISALQWKTVLSISITVSFRVQFCWHYGLSLLF